MSPDKEPMIFRPGSESQPVIIASSVDDLIDGGIHICPTVVADRFGPEALEKYQKVEAERAAARNRAVDEQLKRRK